jgi:hypothetical protein
MRPIGPIGPIAPILPLLPILPAMKGIFITFQGSEANPQSAIRNPQS